MRITGRVPARHMEARAFRGAWIAARTGQTQWKPALESVIGGTWAGARRDEGKRTDTDKGVEQAVIVIVIVFAYWTLASYYNGLLCHMRALRT
jgi:hypothetical protein